MPPTFRPLQKCRVQNSEQWAREVTVLVRGLLAQLGADGWGFQDIAASLDCSRGSLYSWRIGAAEMPASKLLALRALVADNCRKVASK